MFDKEKEKNGQKKEKKGFLSKLFRSSKECGSSCCCDVKIVPQEEMEESQKKERPVEGGTPKE